MKSIEERAKEWGEYIVETAPYDVVNGEVCVFAKDRDIADVAEESYIAGATEQQAIDEEVRLKTSDDMTKAEYDRETAFADWYLKNGKALQHTPMLLSGRGKMLLARLVIGCT